MHTKLLSLKHSLNDVKDITFEKLPRRLDDGEICGVGTTRGMFRGDGSIGSTVCKYVMGADDVLSNDAVNK